MQMSAKNMGAMLGIFLVLIYGLSYLFPASREGFATPYPASNRTRGMPCYNDRQCASAMCSQEKCA
jgi:hypothetical protein